MPPLWPQCEFCKFWRERPPSGPGIVRVREGDCRKRAPIVFTDHDGDSTWAVTRWPGTLNTDGCGEGETA